MTTTESPHLTDEGAQEMAPRILAGGTEVLREVGSVLRISEAEAAEDAPVDAETTIINMGPQHPSTHGVLRLMLELDGETVLRTKPVMATSTPAWRRRRRR